MAMTGVAYPRPDFDRSQRWQSLDGSWDFAPDPADQGVSEQWFTPERTPWSAQIVVPFAWETPMSGIAREWLPIGWYRRQISIEPTWSGERIILHFGAVHYHSTVWVNGTLLGEHTGGYLPFEFDLTDALSGYDAEIVVRVEAPLDKRDIPHGKQRSKPADDYDDCAFTASSGIWQSVWLEPRPATFIESVSLAPTEALDGFNMRVNLAGDQLDGATLTLQIPDHEPIIVPIDGTPSQEIELFVTQPRRWEPASPVLYEVHATLNSAAGTDQVKCYGGLRRIEVQGDQLLLNGERIFLRGALDQGYWPESGYTAPSDDDLRRDVELALAAGYNLIRKHIKLEDPRWLYWADRLGLLIWEEPPCTGRFSPTAVATFAEQIPLMVARDGNHPSIILWGLYNEEWGLDWQSGTDHERQQVVEHAYDRLAACDQSRPIIDDSGWWHVKTDVVDWHYYAEDMSQWMATTAALAHDRLAWFGHRLSDTRWYETQLSIPGRDHQRLPLMNGEYGGGASLTEQGWLLRWQTPDLRRHEAFCGYIYTELYDIEHEVIGIYDAYRRLKDLGCNPAAINAPTVIIFDLTPDQPGCDFQPTESSITIQIRLSHHGNEALTGHVAWGWQIEAPLGQRMVTAQPFQVTEPITLEGIVPDEGPTLRTLQVWFTDTAQQRHASATLDIDTTHIMAQATVRSDGPEEVQTTHT